MNLNGKLDIFAVSRETIIRVKRKALHSESASSKPIKLLKRQQKKIFSL